MISLNTNVSDLILQRTLLESTSGLNEALQRMSTGLKVNHAKDNAAGYSIIEDLNTRISSMLQVQNNTEDGISLLATAQGGLEEIQGLLVRLRDLTMQASNDTYDMKSRASMQAEADAILEEITRIRKSINYDGMNLYETQNTGMISRLAQSAVVNGTSAQSQISLFSVGEGAEVNSSSITSSQSSPTSQALFTQTNNEPVTSPTSQALFTPTDESTTGATTFSLARTVGSDSGVVSLAKNESTTIYIGADNTKTYTITNIGTSAAELSYSKDTTSGQITFTGNRFKIVAQSDTAHDLLINGSNNQIYGGDLKDVITTTSNSLLTSIYGQGGDDEIVINSEQSKVYAGDGSDNITLNSAKDAVVEGGAGNDIFNLKGYGGTNTSVYGGAGEDTYNIENSQYTLFGEGDNDTFNFLKTPLYNVVVNGGDGTNTVTGTVGENITANVVGANSYLADIAANSNIDLTINGIQYNIANNTTTDGTLVYSVSNSGQINFRSLGNRPLVITGDRNVSHNVKLSGQYLTFYGSDLVDTISLSVSNITVFSYAGNDKITFASGAIIFAGEGDDIITSTNGATSSQIRGEAGNDTITITNGYYNSVDTGYGDDTVKLVGSGNYNHSSNYNGFYNPDGNDTLIGSEEHVNSIYGFGLLDNSQAVIVGANSSKDITINGATFNFKNALSYDSIFLYSYDSVTDRYSFFTEEANNIITAQDGIAYNVSLYGKMTFQSGNLNDTIDSYCSGSVYGNDGDDTITSYTNNARSVHGGNGNDTFVSANYLSRNYFYGGAGDDIIKIEEGTSSASGESGNDTYYINSDRAGTVSDNYGNNVYYIGADGRTVTSGAGDDTFYITGNNNTINGQGGKDYFEVTGSGNGMYGGTGHSTFVVDSAGNSISAGEASDVIISVPESDCTILTPNVITIIDTPTVLFVDSNEITTNINGLNYKFTNLSADTNNKVTYVVNENTGLVTFSCSDVQIDCIDNSNYYFSLKGDNNTVNGGILVDNITVEQGSNNTINGNTGNDILVNQSEDNSIDGGGGNDTITLLASTDKLVTGGADNDIINVKSDNNTQIYAGLGDDKIVVTGSNNTIEAQDGNNSINITGAENIINAQDGDNKVVVGGNNNEVTLGSGNNNFGISGNNNTVGSLHTVGNVNINGDENTVILGNVVTTYSTNSSSAFNGDININGSDNTVIQESGNNNVTIKGNGNEYTAESGNKKINTTGDGNTISTSDGNDTVNVKGNSNTVTTIEGKNNITITGNSNQVQGGAGVDTIKLNGNMNTAMGGDGNDSFVLTNGANNTIDGEGGDKNTMVNYSTGINYTNIVDVTPQGFHVDIKVNTGSGEDSFISTDIEFNPIFLNVDLSSKDSALASLVTIDDLIKTVSEQLTNIGSMINRLEYVLEEQNIRLENMISTRSTMRDADIAEESSKMIKYQILQEASATLMASCRNLRQENVLGLLYGLR